MDGRIGRALLGDVRRKTAMRTFRKHAPSVLNQYRARAAAARSIMDHYVAHSVSQRGKYIDGAGGIRDHPDGPMIGMVPWDQDFTPGWQ